MGRKIKELATDAYCRQCFLPPASPETTFSLVPTPKSAIATGFLFVMPNKRIYRSVFAAVLIISGVALIAGLLGGTSTVLSQASTTQNSSLNSEGQVSVPSRENVTVITTDSNSWLRSGKETARSTAEIVAFAPNGSVLYQNDSHLRYWDVDPVPTKRATVVYGSADHLPSRKCPGNSSCTRNNFERLNLTTGETTQIYSGITPERVAKRWHDIDRINDTHLVIAGIDEDRVFIVNATTSKITWEWRTQMEYQTSTGGDYPEDWTHLNDVEFLQDGRIMVSLRNHDQVIFLDSNRRPEKALIENWTLGAEDNDEILHEQHNPDYIPEDNGGPAVVVADSENNRIVEYHRSNKSWKTTWTWTDPRLQWPRDADRLPDGHTLITDSNGNRVFEINERGEIVWEVSIAYPYEAERLGTDDESTNGPGITRMNASNSRSYGLVTRAWLEMRSLLSGPMFSAVLYVLPAWMGLSHFIAGVLFVLTGVSWTALEWWWS